MKENIYNAIRPSRLSEMFRTTSSLEHVKELMTSGKIGRSIFLYGATGCGKTTLARIVAKYMNCSGSGEKPCGVCAQCTNAHHWSIIEMNAADQRGIDDMRALTDEISVPPLNSDFRTVILDECFSPDTLVNTPTMWGRTKIKDIKEGDPIFNLQGISRVRHVFKNKVPLDRVVKIDFEDGETIFCSKDHKFLTVGKSWFRWTKAKDLQKSGLTTLKFRGKIVSTEERYGTEEMRAMQQEIRDTEPNPKVLQQQLQEQSQDKTCGSYLHALWHDIQDKKERKIYGEVLQPEVCLEVEADSTTCHQVNGIKRKGTESARGHTEVSEGAPRKVDQAGQGCLNPNETNEQGSKVQEDGDGKIRQMAEGESNISSPERRERTGNSSPEEAPRGNGIPNGVHDRDEEAKKTETGSPSSDKVRSRSSNSQQEDSNRSRRRITQNEEVEVPRQKERVDLEEVRVESITFYKQGSDDEAFDCVIKDQERSQGFVEFYDLEVEGDHSYFARGMAVHNCHQLSKDAQNALLKTLEECPEHLCIVLCTTEPGKVLPTLKNRCLQIGFDRLGYSESREFVMYTIERLHKSGYIEKKRTMLEPTLETIISMADGSARQLTVLTYMFEETGTVSKVDEEQEIMMKDIARVILGECRWKSMVPLLKKIKTEHDIIRIHLVNYFAAIALNPKDNTTVMRCFELLSRFSEPLSPSNQKADFVGRMVGLIHACRTRK